MFVFNIPKFILTLYFLYPLPKYKEVIANNGDISKKNKLSTNKIFGIMKYPQL